MAAVVTDKPLETARTNPEKLLAPVPGATEVVEGPIPVWADDLVALLERTGTGQKKLDVIARAKVALFESAEYEDLPASDPKRHLTARQALRALMSDPSVGLVTQEKARQFVKTGRYAAPVTGPVKLDAHLPKPPVATAPAPATDEELDAELTEPFRQGGSLDLPVARGDDGEAPGDKSDPKAKGRTAKVKPVFPAPPPPVVV